MVEPTAPKKTEDASKRNWADEDDDAEDGGDDVEIGGASVAQVGKSKTNGDGDQADANDQQREGGEEPRAIVPKKPRQVRERNQYGDFVVTKINIKEREIVVP